MKIEGQLISRVPISQAMLYGSLSTARLYVEAHLDEVLDGCVLVAASLGHKIIEALEDLGARRKDDRPPVHLDRASAL